MRSSDLKRFAAITAFLLFTAVNFLDRQLLAAVAPAIKSEYRLSGAQYGLIASAFGLTYALGAPFAGWFSDRFGLNCTISVAAGLWSFAGFATGLSRSLNGLLGCRMMLGAGESAGMPCLAKTNAVYLNPDEYALSLAANNIAIAVGSSAAPLVVAAMTARFGWRSVFLATGAGGLITVPLWLAMSRISQRQQVADIKPVRGTNGILRDSRMWRLTLSNALIMTVYTVWTNWTTLYLVEELHLGAVDANGRYAWLPPIFGTMGAFFGGWLGLRWMRNGMQPIAARLRGCRLAAAFLVAGALVPLAKSPAWATLAISGVMFWAMSLQLNVHILPVDVFGPKHAGFSVSVLACSYGLMQAFVSPVVGIVTDRFGFTAVCAALALLPLAGVWLLRPLGTTALQCKVANV